MDGGVAAGLPRVTDKLGVSKQLSTLRGLILERGAPRCGPWDRDGRQTGPGSGCRELHLSRLQAAMTWAVPWLWLAQAGLLVSRAQLMRLRSCLGPERLPVQ